jgi:hypothetical protein
MGSLSFFAVEVTDSTQFDDNGETTVSYGIRAKRESKIIVRSTKFLLLCKSIDVNLSLYSYLQPLQTLLSRTT